MSIVCHACSHGILFHHVLISMPGLKHIVNQLQFRSSNRFLQSAHADPCLLMWSSPSGSGQHLRQNWLDAPQLTAGLHLNPCDQA